MDAQIEPKYDVSIGDRHLGLFTWEELKAIHRATGKQLAEIETTLNGKAAIILEAVARYFEIPVGWLTQDSRTPKAKEERRAWPRQIAMALIREFEHLPYQQIGDIFSRDHGAVVHACRVVSARANGKHDGKAVAALRAEVAAFFENHES